MLAVVVTPSEVVSLVRKWLDEERLFVKQQNDPRAHAHFLIKYPQGKQGHMFAVVVPKNRDLVAISSMTRVDEGQQNEMTNHMTEDKDGWAEWIHEARLQLINSAVDWGIHMGHKDNKKPGPSKRSMLVYQSGLMELQKTNLCIHCDDCGWQNLV